MNDVWTNLLRLTCREQWRRRAFPSVPWEPFSSLLGQHWESSKRTKSHVREHIGHRTFYCPFSADTLRSIWWTIHQKRDFSWRWFLSINLFSSLTSKILVSNVLMSSMEDKYSQFDMISQCTIQLCDSTEKVTFSFVSKFVQAKEWHLHTESRLLWTLVKMEGNRCLEVEDERGEGSVFERKRASLTHIR